MYLLILSLVLAFIVLLIVNKIEKRKEQNVFADYFRFTSLSNLIYGVLILIFVVVVGYFIIHG